MAIFYDICDYLEISPADFFFDDKEYPAQLNRIMEYAECPTDQQLVNSSVQINESVSTRIYLAGEMMILIAVPVFHILHSSEPSAPFQSSLPL